MCSDQLQARRTRVQGPEWARGRQRVMTELLLVHEGEEEKGTPFPSTGLAGARRSRIASSTKRGAWARRGFCQSPSPPFFPLRPRPRKGLFSFEFGLLFRFLKRECRAVVFCLGLSRRPFFFLFFFSKIDSDSASEHARAEVRERERGQSCHPAPQHQSGSSQA